MTLPTARVYYSHAEPGWFYQILPAEPVGPFDDEIAAGSAARIVILEMSPETPAPGPLEVSAPLPPPRPHAAQMRIDAELIAQLLRLPPGWQVRHIRLASDRYYDELVMVVEGDDLPPVAIGEVLAELIGRHTRHPDGTETIEWQVKS